MYVTGALLIAQSVKNAPAVRKSACNAGEPGLIPGSGGSPGEGNGSPLQDSCLENPVDRGTWQATVLGVPRVRHDLATKPPYVCKVSLNRKYTSNKVTS